MSDNPTFNSKEYSWKDVKVFMNGKQITGVSSVDFKEAIQTRITDGMRNAAVGMLIPPNGYEQVRIMEIMVHEISMLMNPAQAIKFKDSAYDGKYTVSDYERIKLLASQGNLKDSDL